MTAPYVWTSQVNALFYALVMITAITMLNVMVLVFGYLTVSTVALGFDEEQGAQAMRTFAKVSNIYREFYHHLT